MSTVQAHTTLPNHIGGRWKNSTAAEFLKVVNPATNELLAEVPVSPEREVVEAIEAAAAAFPEWRRTPPEERIQYLFKM